jgi:hypothetical protein
MEVTNILIYYDMEFITTVKGFMAQATGLCNIQCLFFTLQGRIEFMATFNAPVAP